MTNGQVEDLEEISRQAIDALRDTASMLVREGLPQREYLAEVERLVETCRQFEARCDALMSALTPVWEDRP